MFCNSASVTHNQLHFKSSLCVWVLVLRGSGCLDKIMLHLVEAELLLNNTTELRLFGSKRPWRGSPVGIGSRNSKQRPLSLLGIPAQCMDILDIIVVK